MHATDQSIPYDFDIHQKNSYMYWWTKNYMDATYRAAIESKYPFSGKSLLDIGIGRGRSLALFQKLGLKKITGIDISEKETLLAKKQAARLAIPITIIIDDEYNRKLKSLRSNSFDVVSLMNILFCVSKEKVRKTILDEAQRIVKPHGIVIIMDMQKPSLMWFFSKITMKNWVFRSTRELLRYCGRLHLIHTYSSNHFYFINQPLNLLIALGGLRLIGQLNKIFARIGIPSSTKTYIFCKKHD